MKDSAALSDLVRSEKEIYRKLTLHDTNSVIITLISPPKSVTHLNPRHAKLLKDCTNGLEHRKEKASFYQGGDLPGTWTP